MLDTTKLKEYAQLSQAAYAYFAKTDFSGFGGKEEIIEGKLQTVDKGDFTKKEAEELTSRYELVDQFAGNSREQ